MIDHAKVRRESMRWQLLNMLNKARPHTTPEHQVLDTLRVLWPDTTQNEIRRELDYLTDRQLVTITKQPSGMWFADLTRVGVDLVEYTIDCEPGIARPEKYWRE